MAAPRPWSPMACSRASPSRTIGFALHVGPGPYGYVGYKRRRRSTRSPTARDHLQGPGGHGSRAGHDHRSDRDGRAASSPTCRRVISREKDPAGSASSRSARSRRHAGNIIPDTAILRGTIRSYKPRCASKMLAGVRRTAKAAAMMAGAPEPEVELVPGGAGRGQRRRQWSRRPVAALEGAGSATRKWSSACRRITASEDFSEFVDAGVPSMFFFVGGLDPQQVAA